MPISQEIKESGLSALAKGCDRQTFHEICKAYEIDSDTETALWIDVDLLKQDETVSLYVSDTSGLSDHIEIYLCSLIADAAKRDLKVINFPIPEFIGNIMHVIDEIIRKISDKFKIPSVVLFTFIMSGMLPMLAPVLAKLAAKIAENYLPAPVKAALNSLYEAAREYLNTIAVKQMGEKIGQMSTTNKLLTELLAFKVPGMPLKLFTDKFTDLPETQITNADTGSALLGGMCLMYGVGLFMGSDIVSDFVNSLPSDAFLVPGLFALQFVSSEAHTMSEQGFSILIVPSQLFVGYKTCVGIKSGLDSEYTNKQFAERLVKTEMLKALENIPSNSRTIEQETQIKYLKMELNLVNPKETQDITESNESETSSHEEE